jgi:hypothetical protein
MQTVKAYLHDRANNSLDVQIDADHFQHAEGLTKGYSTHIIAQLASKASGSYKGLRTMCRSWRLKPVETSGTSDLSEVFLTRP